MIVRRRRLGSQIHERAARSALMFQRRTPTRCSADGVLFLASCIPLPRDLTRDGPPRAGRSAPPQSDPHGLRSATHSVRHHGDGCALQQQSHFSGRPKTELVDGTIERMKRRAYFRWPIAQRLLLTLTCVALLRVADAAE